MIEISQRLRRLKASWQGLDNRPDDLACLGLPGKDSRYIEDLIDQLVRMSGQLEGGADDDLAMTRALCESLLKQAEAFFSPDSSISYPSMRMLSFVTLLQQLRTTLRAHLADAAATGRSDRVA
ncbi:MAG TPA: hypothetical protein VNH42_03985 [Mariprofundaceae bacterium]|nr:hypothetical protein [Mariprofundaceae bacterium]